MKILWAAVFFNILFLANPAYAHVETLSVGEMMDSMMVSQNVSSIEGLDCGKISDEEFEELGDGVMERMVGDHELHEQMDEMMGGEGSESLTQVHIAMGMNWLNCGNLHGMMDHGNMMMPMMMRMMGNYYPAFYNTYDFIVAIAVIGWALLVVAVIYFHLELKPKKRHR